MVYIRTERYCYYPCHASSCDLIHIFFVGIIVRGTSGAESHKNSASSALLGSHFERTPFRRTTRTQLGAFELTMDNIVLQIRQHARVDPVHVAGHTMSGSYSAGPMSRRRNKTEKMEERGKDERRKRKEGLRMF